MRALALAFVFLAGCSASNISQCFHAAGAYEVTQIAIEGYVTSPGADAEVKDVLKEVDLRAVRAIEDCKRVAHRGDDVAFYLGNLAAVTQQVREILDEDQ